MNSGYTCNTCKIKSMKNVKDIITFSANIYKLAFFQDDIAMITLEFKKVFFPWTKVEPTKTNLTYI